MNFDKIADSNKNRKSHASDVQQLIDAADSGEQLMIPMSKIKEYTDSKGGAQPFTIDDDKVEALAASIEENGLIEPIVVRETENGEYQILAGHHRYRACRKCSFRDIECKIVNVSDWEAYRIVVESNVHHGKPKPTDMMRILVEYKAASESDLCEDKLTNSMIAKAFDISERHLYRYLIMMKLDDRINALIDDESVAIGAVDDIKQLDTNQQKLFAEYVDEVGKAFNASKCKKLVKIILSGASSMEEIDEAFESGKKKKKYKTALYNDIENLQLKAKVNEHTEEELNELVTNLLAKHFGVELNESEENSDEE
ncbi:ParB-like nuclease domain-containing protein [Ruminococcus sp. YE71]|uniref:ParB/RepB/Spo0J family partition protein n=1 Tax=unclassified Ruminococcus TaxID=2608920 RepID=UPI00088F65F7|nr:MULTISPECIES: ParB N-terminal domain-containing protein [unclassified Ruminococcus]SDA30054.1 ParB-like nuclease domain-containing protein [Ruminococcus sp. YE78]SFW49118.1 ParB-like nuclease domain-containing protein [Ruminococcus sp. YE71]